MSDIPQDIMETAVTAFEDAIASVADNDMDPCFWMVEDVRDAAEPIARAIQAERARCAKVAASQSWFVQMSPEHIRSRKPEEYAAAILSGT